MVSLMPAVCSPAVRVGETELGLEVGLGHCWLDWLPTGVVKEDLPGLLVVAAFVAASGHAELTDGVHAGCKASGQIA